MGYRDCIFDLYGTLVDIRTDERSPALWEAMAARYREFGAVYMPPELADAYFRTVRDMEQSEDLRADAHEAHPEIKLELVFQRLYRDKGVLADLDRAVETGRYFRKCSLDYLRLYDGARELLQTLRDNGRRVWLLSNAQRIFTMYELDSLGLTGYFDGIYLSSDYGVKKPDPRFFRRLLTEQSIRPEDAIMVGNDGLCDILGAKNVGLATVYIRSNISPKEPLPDADFVLDHMDLSRVGEILTRA